ncbi:T9SS type A sorting domain-containing protein [Flavobacterium silvaticum]|uniref:T9SS type A sorting domain-containing protein n=1 Tax=Flavobacterium silvaticum TaxID=1852020 RepID=A0A972JFN3_9FLAO|nr:T9SS type A sorting domain-containing protein [Flavobacterium silvaticum]NMH28154.1 T9SS type A sorting domain-containing protein [Flavobacterium silvaticum]
MKNLYLFLAVTATAFSWAQVPNASFEEFTGYGNETRFWGPNPIIISITIPIDGGPSVATPTIVYEEGTYNYCFFTDEAHTGNRAMELRNAYNLTDAVVVPGKMILFNEDQGSTTASGWNAGYQMTPETVVEGLGFYYKFFPMGNDVAQAKIELFNSSSGLVGSAVVNLSGTHSEYTYAWSPIQLLSDDVPTFMRVDFSMTDGISSPTLGSRLVVDDIATVNVVLSDATLSQKQFQVYPTLADHEINLVKGSGISDGSKSVEIFTADGKSVSNQLIEFFGNNPAKINVSTLSHGIYFLRIENNVLKFVKR